MYFFLMGAWNAPEYVIRTRGQVFLQTAKGKHVLKRAESHLFEVNRLGFLACNFSTFFKVSKRDSF